MNIWEIAILECMSSIGEVASLPQLYKNISNFKPLTEKDLKETEHGGRPAYQHQMRSHMSNLYQAGDIKRVSRGCYSLTDNGRKRIC